jgi:hypothetical protein
MSDMPVTRSQQRGELTDEGASQGADDERLSEDEASEIGLEETLHSVKGVLGEIKDEESKLKELYKQVSGENRVLAERIERLESQDTVGWINRQADLETRINSLQGNIERLTATSRSYEEIERQLETSSAEIRSVRTHFTESFEGLLSAVEGLDKELQSTVADLQGKINDISKLCLPGSPKAKSTEMKTGRRDLSFNETRGSSQQVKESNSLRKQKPVQPCPKFSGKTSWEVFQAQFSIAAEMNGWQDDDKAVFLATALEGRAAMVLGSLSDKERRDYNKLVTALTVRFGMAHQSELARAKLKCRSRGKEESIPELAESVETLTRAAYPDASSDLQDTIAKDNFIDALLDEDMRLKVRQARPQSLQAALENALELESFQLASRHRNRTPRGPSLNVRKVNENIPPESDENSSIKRLELMIDRLLQELTKNPRRRPPRPPTSAKCWSCGEPGHLQRNCPKESKEQTNEPKNEVSKEMETKKEDQQRKLRREASDKSRPGNGRWSS